jgi:hypothetical protein
MYPLAYLFAGKVEIHPLPHTAEEIDPEKPAEKGYGSEEGECEDKEIQEKTHNTGGTGKCDHCRRQPVAHDNRDNN